MSSNDDIKLDLSEPVLELPPAPDAPSAEITSLLGADGDALVSMTSKVLALEQFLRLLTHGSSYHDFMHELLLIIMKVIKSEAGSLFEMDEAHQNLFFRAVVGQVSDKLASFTVPVGKGIVGHVAESRQPLVVNDVEENRQHLKAMSSAVAFEARNIVAVPIFVRTRVFGVVELLNRVGSDGYLPADVEMLTYLCDLASRVIEARLMIGWAMRAQDSSVKNSSKEAA